MHVSGFGIGGFVGLGMVDYYTRRRVLFKSEDAWPESSFSARLISPSPA
jgi:hypothetical protein